MTDKTRVDNTEATSSEPSPSTDLSIFHSDAKLGKNSIHRLLSSLKYYSSLNVPDNNKDNQNIFINFMGEVYKHQIIDDFNYLQKRYDHQLENIIKYAKKNYQIKLCDIKTCTYSDRHYRIDSTNRETETNI